MMPYNYDFEFYQGDAIDFSIEIFDVDASDNETPKNDLDQYLIELRVKENKNYTPTILLFSSSEGGITITNNIIRFTKSSSEIGEIPPIEYVYDLKLKDLSLDIFTYLEGNFKINDDV